MNGLALCSGIGCIDLGLRIATGGRYRVVCHVEREAYPATTLVARMEDQAMDLAPVWDDIATFDGRPWRGLVDIVTAGLPCQPYSLAGKRKGHDDERALWPEFVRIVDECEPGIIFLENVPSFLRFYGPVWTKLSRMGFIHAPPLLHTTHEVGGISERRRLFVLAAHPDRAAIWEPEGSERECKPTAVNRTDRNQTADAEHTERRPQHQARREEGRDVLSQGKEGPGRTRGGGRETADSRGLGRREGQRHLRSSRGQSDTDGSNQQTANTDGARLQGHAGHEHRATGRKGQPARSSAARGPTADTDGQRLKVEWSGWLFDSERQTFRHDADRCDLRCRICGSPWATESPVVRVDHGTAHRLVELRATGNGVVPWVAAQAWIESLRSLTNDSRE